MKKILKFCFLTALLLLSTLAFSQNGSIKGKIIDANTNEAIIGANVIISGTTKGTSSDIEGNFEISGLEPGFYSVSASFLGYRTETKTEIQVTNSRPAFIDFVLEEEDEVTEEVVILASPFKKVEESPVSLQTIGTAEIQRNPGGNRDISKVIRVLPGVTTTNSFRNDLIIRGGAPNENRFYLDDIEVPNINHYATQGASGGPQGLLNVDLISEVDFYSGAFPSNRGNSLSSIFNFRQKNARTDRVGLTASVGATDVSMALEGPLSKNKKTTFLLSARQSYLQFLFKAIGLPFLPTYNDFQFKVRTTLKNNDEFYVTGLGALDRFKLNLDANETAEQRYLLNNIPINNQWNYAVGAVYKKFLKNSYMTFVLSRNMLNNDIFKYIDNNENNARSIDYNSQESENKFRAEHTLRFGKGFKLNYGVGYELVRFYTDSKLFALINGAATQVTYQTELNFSKYSAFGQLSKKMFSERLILSLGMRMDGNSYSKEMQNPLNQFSPRFSLSFALTENLTFNANTGIFYQLPAYTAMGYKENGVFVNQDRLKFIRSIHAVAGFAYNLRLSTKISVEGFYKKYNNYPFLLNENIALANFGGDFGVVGNAPLDARGEGRTYGVEFLIQQKLYKGFFGILAYTFGFSEFKDKNNEYVFTSWDSRHIVNASFGKNFDIMNKTIMDKRNARRVANGKEARSKKLVSQTLQLGLNFRLQTGLPYTPFDSTTSALTANWDRFGRAVLDYNLLNTERTNLFYGVDFRIDYKWYFSKWSLNLYFDLQNFPSQAAQVPQFILNEDANGNPQVVNQGQPNQSYLLQRVNNTLSVSVPSIGVIVQF
jgi:outer membrane receptor for ferrienterochelin and colicin